MTNSIQDIIRRRYSCRTFSEKPITDSHLQMMKKYLDSLGIGPLGTRIRFDLAATVSEDSTSLKGLGTYGFIKNPAGFIIGAAEQNTFCLEDYGYLLESIVLKATDVGLGTCWLGGSFSKSGFAKKIKLQENEILPAVIATGYDINNNGSREFIRKLMNAHRRLPMEYLFFDKSFTYPIKIETAGPYAIILKMVRLAPSASNKQPWRIVQDENKWHFFLQRTKGYGKGTFIFNVLKLADLQRVDIGIAMCHFEYSARSLGLKGNWKSVNSNIHPSEGIEYIVSWINE